MSSIYRLLKKGKVGPLFLGLSEANPVLAKRLHSIATDHAENCFLVNIQSSIDEVLECTDVEMPDDLPVITSPHPHLWLEGIISGKRLAMQVICADKPDGGGFQQEFFGWTEDEGHAELILWRIQAEIAHEGKMDSASWVLLNPVPAQESDLFQPALSRTEDRLKRVMVLLMAIVCHAFCKMHCKNVQVTPPWNDIAEARSRRRDKPLAALASVWRTIEIKEETPRRQLNTGNGYKKTETRLRWIRGHYADYRAGKGLFGDAKRRLLYWIPAHPVGNPALGEEIPEYQV